MIRRSWTRLRISFAFYHEHIRKEDEIFYPACMNYLSEEEKEPLLQEFREADRQMIHAKYGALVESLEGRR